MKLKIKLKNSIATIGTLITLDKTLLKQYVRMYEIVWIEL